MGDRWGLVNRKRWSLLLVLLGWLVLPVIVAGFGGIGPVELLVWLALLVVWVFFFIRAGRDSAEVDE